MRAITVAEGVNAVLDAIAADRLSLLLGAGLSMAKPSQLPSAAAIAARARELYAARFGNDRPPLPASIDEQAEYFFSRGELSTVYLRYLIDEHAFAGPPNVGHFAVADLLLAQAARIAVTTNVDSLVETAGQLLFGQLGVAIDRNAVAALPPGRSPLLKIHGCRSIDYLNSVWAKGQLDAEPLKQRVTECAEWLGVRLLDSDLLIVGYATDWDYLNEVLAKALGQVRPSAVVIVNLGAPEEFAVKAPLLAGIGDQARTFLYVQVSGDVFLDIVRKQFSRMHIRQVLHSAAESFAEAARVEPDPVWLEPPDVSSDALWKLRRDLDGCLPGHPAVLKDPPHDELVGLTILQLRARGATFDGAGWRLGDLTIRVLRAAGKLLHRVESAYGRDEPQVVASDVVIAVGAESLTLPDNIVRVTSAPTVARGSVSRWMTRQDAVSEFAL